MTKLWAAFWLGHVHLQEGCVRGVVQYRSCERLEHLGELRRSQTTSVVCVQAGVLLTLQRCRVLNAVTTLSAKCQIPALNTEASQHKL